MKVLVIGSGGFIGRALVEALKADHEVTGTDRTGFDLADLGSNLEWIREFDVVYLCAAKSRFVDCETDPTAYRVNVDAPIIIATWAKKLIFLSSNAVEIALHTNYGMHKALAETVLRGMPNVTIARICHRVMPDDLPALTETLVALAKCRPGLYRFTPNERILH